MSCAIGDISLRSQLAMTEERIKYWLEIIQDCSEFIRSTGMNKSYYTNEFPSMDTCPDSLWHERFQWWMNKIPHIMSTDVMDTATILTLQGAHQWITHYQLMLRQEVEYKLRRSLR